MDDLTETATTPEESKAADTATSSQCPVPELPSSLEETVMDAAETSVTTVDERKGPSKSETFTTDVESSRVEITKKDSRKPKGLSRPSHILMALSAPSSSSLSSLETQSIQGDDRVEMSRIDPRIKRDYISKRKRAYEGVSSNGTSNRSSGRDAAYSVSGTIANIWDGVSKVERLLVQCCELLPDDRGDNNNNNNDIRSNNSTDDYFDDDDEDDGLHKQHALGGVLAVENEVRFAAILASHCHSMALKSLALAILERTLEAYLVEAYIKQKQDEEERASVRNDDDDDKMEIAIDNSSDTNVLSDLKDSSDCAESHIDNRSSRFTRVQQRHKRVKAEGSGESMDVSSAEKDGIGETHEKGRRLELFFEVGGLKILNQWLADASSYEVVPFKSTPSSSAAKTAASSMTVGRERKASSTRPIILTILRFLEHIPFDKKVVLNSKINKQIHKLGKRVTAILDDISDGKANREDLENWTTDDTVTESVALTQTREAVDAVKASWLEKTKNLQKKEQQSEKVVDPFASTKEKIRERMEILARFQNGEISQPEWYQPPLVTTSTGTRKSPPTGSTLPGEKKKKLNTQELAAQERKAEREKLQQRIEQVQSRRVEKLEQLRERLRQKKEKEWNAVAVAVPGIQSKSSKRVAWKDGSHSQIVRNRQLLEEVFVFIKDTASAEGTGEGIEDTAAIETFTKVTT